MFVHSDLEFVLENISGSCNIMTHLNQKKNGMYTANELASFFFKSCSLSAWRREDGTCSISVRGLHLPYTILHCEFINTMHLLGYHSLFSP